MGTILLAWNPNNYPWGDLQDELAQVKRDCRVSERWSVGNRNHLQSGTRFFMIRLGSEPRGIVGSGWTTSEPYHAPHWDIEKANKGKMALYADIYFDTLDLDPLIPIQELQVPPFDHAHWSTQMSGISIPDDIATELEKLWVQRRGSDLISSVEEHESVSPLVEGNAKKVFVNRYERSPHARALCLAHYGLRCTTCDILMSDVYGTAAEGLTHVHHLTPLEQIAGEYEIDPIRDLRPVCPNCHAVIHSRNPIHSLDEMSDMIRKSSKDTHSE